jgi:hypothetical protein
MQTPFSNTGYFLNLGKSILDSLADALECNGLDVPGRVFVGFERPPQDLCPELVVWIGNIRTWDGDFPDTRSSGRLLCSNGYAFDVSVRIGRCYIDMDEDGQPLDGETLQDWAGELYRDVTALYMGWINQWRAGNVTELSMYDLVTVGACTQYNSGGCAGHEFTITVGTFG